MHPRIAELFEYLDRQREALRQAVESVPSEQYERRPAPDRWSVAEVLEHLGIVERRLTRLFASRLAEARGAGLGSEQDAALILPTMETLLKQVADRGRRITAVDAVQPRTTRGTAAAWTALADTRAAFKQAVVAGDGHALGEVFHPHPALGPLDLYQWVAFVGGHEARHAAQIRETGALMADHATAASTPPTDEPSRRRGSEFARD